MYLTITKRQPRFHPVQCTHLRFCSENLDACQKFREIEFHEKIRGDKKSREIQEYFNFTNLFASGCNMKCEATFFQTDSYRHICTNCENKENERRC